MGGTRSRPSFPWKARPDRRPCARSPSPLVLHSITRGIFETIVEQAPLAIEELMNELEAQEEEEEEETSEGEEQDRAVLPGKPPRGETPAPGGQCLAWVRPLVALAGVPAFVSCPVPSLLAFLPKSVPSVLPG